MPENEVHLARQDALRFLREATYNIPVRAASPRIDTPDIPVTPKMVISDMNDLDIKVVLDGPLRQDPEAEELIRVRHAALATLPVPEGIPSDALKPILIPPTYSLQEFLASAIGALRTALANHRILQQLTTNWCPDREEHGYFLTPLFKCSTNPRVATAHRWTMVDVISRFDKPTGAHACLSRSGPFIDPRFHVECFYNKDGKWYYAGVYKAIRLDDLTPKEFEQMSTETTQALIKETLSGRKNVSPQIVYETTQLYMAGALKVACVGLQCVGFNNLLYKTILDQVTKCAHSGRWRNAFGFDLSSNSDAVLTPRLFSLPGTPVHRSADGDVASNSAQEFCKTR
ncbi:hypothetical protein BC834DRAFT_686467 [Gloeopeniophorella convolvens]|nr:hypothetical protein BC834DRAFT_686467 [Gloeopeniophorella convolvens]